MPYFSYFTRVENQRLKQKQKHYFDKLTTHFLIIIRTILGLIPTCNCLHLSSVAFKSSPLVPGESRKSTIQVYIYCLTGSPIWGKEQANNTRPLGMAGRPKFFLLNFKYLVSLGLLYSCRDKAKLINSKTLIQ